MRRSGHGSVLRLKHKPGNRAALAKVDRPGTAFLFIRCVVLVLIPAPPLRSTAFLQPESVRQKNVHSGFYNDNGDVGCKYTTYIQHSNRPRPAGKRRRGKQTMPITARRRRAEPRARQPPCSCSVRNGDGVLKGGPRHGVAVGVKLQRRHVGKVVRFNVVGRALPAVAKEDVVLAGEGDGAERDDEEEVRHVRLHALAVQEIALLRAANERKRFV